MKSYSIFFSIIFLTVFSLTLILNTPDAFGATEKKTIIVPPGESDFIKIELEQHEVIDFGFQISGRDDNQIRFWLQNPNGTHVIPTKTYDLSAAKLSHNATKAGAFAFFFENPSDALFNEKSITLLYEIKKPPRGGGCLIATAAFGSELAPQVQFLREVRDNVLLSTTSGSSFMTEFNNVYYTFSPTIADLEREYPMFRESVKTFITPMISTLSILSFADEGSEEQVLGLGISVIALNLGMYIIVPTIVIVKIQDLFKKN